MEHADFYVLAGTAFPILLLAMFATETRFGDGRYLRSRKLRQLMMVNVLGYSVFAGVGLTLCVVALMADADSSALRHIVLALLILTLLVLIGNGCQNVARAWRSWDPR